MQILIDGKAIPYDDSKFIAILKAALNNVDDNTNEGVGSKAAKELLEDKSIYDYQKEVTTTPVSLVGLKANPNLIKTGTYTVHNDKELEKFLGKEGAKNFGEVKEYPFLLTIGKYPKEDGYFVTGVFKSQLMEVIGLNKPIKTKPLELPELKDIDLYGMESPEDLDREA